MPRPRVRARNPIAPRRIAASAKACAPEEPAAAKSSCGMTAATTDTANAQSGAQFHGAGTTAARAICTDANRPATRETARRPDREQQDRGREDQIDEDSDDRAKAGCGVLQHPEHTAQDEPHAADHEGLAPLSHRSTLSTTCEAPGAERASESPRRFVVTPEEYHPFRRLYSELPEPIPVHREEVPAP